MRALRVARRAFAAAAISVTALSGTAHAADCDAKCLKGFVDKYLAALVAHDPSKLPVAGTVRYTENGQELPLGEAIWVTNTGLGTYKNYFADPEAGQVAFYGTIHEGDSFDIMALRLKIADKKITEVEAIVARPSGGAGSGVTAQPAVNLEKIGKPNPLWSQVIPKAKRMSREDLIKTANKYFTGLQKNDGKGDYPFTDDCNRLENGTQTTNMKMPMGGQAADSPMAKVGAMGCKGQFASGLYNMVARIRDRRFLVVDPVHGAVTVFAFFDHDGRPPPPVTYEGKTVQSRGLLWTWEISESFKIEKGQIRFVEAVLTQAPYGMKPNWPE
ncbi:MAG: hypothetical protein WAW96_16425 [Alphaproteobacteria bacterium]